MRSKGNYDVLNAVADSFILSADPVLGDLMSNLRLQKLVYYTQAWHLAHHGGPAFPDRIEAWRHGPVVPRLYQRFRNYGGGAIPLVVATSDIDGVPDSVEEIIKAVWSQYGGLTAGQLERQTHMESPWKQAYTPAPGTMRCENEITHKSMRDFYRQYLS
jgi:uncharacterized phage-associated protein